MDAGHTISTQSLADQLWDYQPPNKARGNLQVLVSRLRRRLREAGGDGRLIVSAPAGGYRIDVPADDIDAKRFQRLFHQALAARRSDPHQARALLREAQDLWGGEPLAGIDGGQWVENTRQTLLQYRHTAALTRIEIDLDLGGHGEDVIGELTALAGAEHTDEKVVKLLMRALAVAGRAEEALARFREVQARLRARGMDPGLELRTLHQSILRGESQAPPPTTPAAPPQTPNTLDPNPRYLMGRDADLADLEARVGADLRSGSGPALYAVDGLPGIGKTSFAVRAAHHLRDRCPDGWLQISMRTHRLPQSPLSAREALEQLLDALGVSYREIQRADSEAGLAALWRRRTAGRRLLLLIDDVASADQVVPLVPTSPGSIVLLTSRRCLVGLPELRQRTLHTLPDPAAGELLTALTGREPSDHAAGLDRFARWCGGLPQAIVLAAGLLDTHPTWTLADLNDRLGASQAGSADDQVSARMNALFATSYQALPEHLRTLLCLMAAHPGPDTEPLAAAALTGTDPAAATLALEALQEHRLVQETGPNRYRLHDLLREFALDQLERSQDSDIHRRAGPDVDAALRHLVDAYATGAITADDAVHRHRPATVDPRELDSPAAHWARHRRFAGPAPARAWLDAELANLLAVDALAHRRGWHRHAAVLPLILAEYLDHRGAWNQALQILRRTEEAWETAGAPGPGSTTAARLLTDLAAAHIRTPDLNQALFYAERARDAWTADGDRHGLADAHVQIGRVHWHGRHPSLAVAAFEEAVRLYEDVGDPVRRAKTEDHLSVQLFEIGRKAEAIKLERRALETAREVDDPELRCDVLTNLGEMYRETGHTEQALDLFHEGVPIAESLGDPHNIAVLASNIGAAHADRGEYDAAEPSFHKALDLFQIQGDRRNQIDTLIHLADARRRRGDDAAALEHLDSASQLATSLQDPLRRSRVDLATGRSLQDQGRTAEALPAYRSALELAEQADAPMEQLKSLQALGALLLALGDPEADACAQQAEALNRRIEEEPPPP